LLKRNLKKLKNRVSGTLRRRHTQHFIRRGDGVAPTVPHFVVYEPTLLCNLHCSFCYVADILNPEDWSSKELTLDELDRIFVRGAVKSVNITGGEPFVRKNLLDVFRHLQQKGMHCDYVTTNGTKIGGDKAEALADLAASGFLRHISVSIDGPREFHDEIRGQRGAFDKAVDNIRELRRVFAARGLDLPVSVNTTLTAGNLHLLRQTVDAVSELEVDLIGLNQLMFATRKEVQQTLEILGESDPDVISTYVTDDPGIDPKSVASILKDAVAYAESKGITINWRPAQSYEHLEKYYTPDQPLRGQCFYPYFGGRITYDGKVHFCPFIRVEMGDVREQPLEAIWNSDKFVGLRKKLLEHGIFPVCRRCCKVELADARRVGFEEPVSEAARV
jgi:MoaA/NifB/PqqE/SkfB family radical SAM enzyme